MAERSRQRGRAERWYSEIRPSSKPSSDRPSLPYQIQHPGHVDDVYGEGKGPGRGRDANEAEPEEPVDEVPSKKPPRDRAPTVAPPGRARRQTLLGVGTKIERDSAPATRSQAGSCRQR